MRQSVLVLVLCATAFGQTFDLASVKPAAVAGAGRRGNSYASGGPGTKDPGQITYTNVSMMGLILRAYKVDSWQISGPSWLDSEEYDITAKIPEGTTREQFRVMLQNLLAERFHMVARHETRDLPSYELVVAKRGSKLKETTFVEGPTTPSAPGQFKTDENGFLILDRPNMATRFESGPKGPMADLTAKAQPLTRLAEMLSGQVHANVTDKTGLTAKYDFTLEYTPEYPGAGPAPDDAAPPLIAALQEQLGLRLDAKKIPTDVIVIDKADKVPTAN